MSGHPSIQSHDPAKGCCPEQNGIRHYTKKRGSIDDGLQWGSDPSFCFHGFSCPIGTWTEDRMVQNLKRDLTYMCSDIDINILGSMEFDPLEYSTSHNIGKWDSIIFKNEDASLNFDNGRSNFVPMSVPALTPTSSASSASPDERKDVAPPNKKKRKCTQTPGQTLCHCRSEKKRRDAVGEGYRNLCRTVPGLERNNFTRKYILDETARYVESLVKGNEELYRKLEHLKQDEVKDDIPLFEGLIE
ncbi:hypothetical protein N7507_004339 [Penicillium longicatenatum]|nr:hypothetical protein N7507_004339 [Penicillium longicatenatum]